MESNWPLLSRNPAWRCSPQTDTHYSRFHPQVRIGDVVALLNRTPNILGVTLDTQFTFVPHAHDCVERASQRHEIPSWVELGFHNCNYGGHLQDHCASHPQFCHSYLVYPSVLNPPGQTWSDPEQGPEDRDWLPSKGPETGVLFLRAHLELCSQQLYASALQPMHPIHLIVTTPLDPWPLRATLQASCNRM